RYELEPARVAIVGVLGPDARVVEAGRDRVRGGDLPVVALEQIAHAPVQNPDVTGRHRGAVTAGGDAGAAGLDAHDADGAIADERMKEPDRVRAAAHARDQHVRQPAQRAAGLAPRLSADDG